MGFFQAISGLLGGMGNAYGSAYGGLLGMHPSAPGLQTASGLLSGPMMAPGPDGPLITHNADMSGLTSAPPQMGAGASSPHWAMAPLPPTQAPDMSMPQGPQAGPVQGQGVIPGSRFQPIQALGSFGFPRGGF